MVLYKKREKKAVMNIHMQHKLPEKNIPLTRGHI